MKKFIATLLLLLFGILNTSTSLAQASVTFNKNFKVSQNNDYRKAEKEIKQMLKIHLAFANKHDIEALKPLYSDDFINNDGFNKEVYFKNVEETWEECKDLTYRVKILDINVQGKYATVTVEENAYGTVLESDDNVTIAGEIHSKSTGIYHLNKIGDKWLIVGENILYDESSLLYGDARFMNIEFQTPSQVSSGDNYTATIKVDADENTFIIASIDRDLVTYPAKIPAPPLRTMPQTKILERILQANSDNINEFAVASLAISKTGGSTMDDYKLYLAGLACLMKRVNVIPKNNFVNLPEVKNNER